MLFVFDIKDRTFCITNEEGRYLRPAGNQDHDRKCMYDSKMDIIFTIRTVLQCELYIVKGLMKKGMLALTDNASFYKEHGYDLLKIS
jgi:hypothetical protein